MSSLTRIIREALGGSSTSLIGPQEPWAEILMDLKELGFEPDGNEDLVDSRLVRAIFRIMEDKTQFLADKYKITPEQVQEYAQADPTPNKAYLDWVIRHVVGGKIVWPEDIEKTKENLSAFDKAKKTPRYTGQKDLNKLTPTTLYAEIEKHGGVKSKKDEIKELEMAGVKKLIGSMDHGVFEITTPEAAAVAFRGTNWCVKDPKYFAHYKPNRYYLITHEGKRYALYHPESNQLRATTDAPLTLKEAYPCLDLFDQADLLPGREQVLQTMLNLANRLGTKKAAVNTVVITLGAMKHFPEDVADWVDEIILGKKKEVPKKKRAARNKFTGKQIFNLAVRNFLLGTPPPPEYAAADLIEVARKVTYNFGYMVRPCMEVFVARLGGKSDKDIVRELVEHGNVDMMDLLMALTIREDRRVMSRIVEFQAHTTYGTNMVRNYVTMKSPEDMLEIAQSDSHNFRVPFSMLKAPDWWKNGVGTLIEVARFDGRIHVPEASTADIAAAFSSDNWSGKEAFSIYKGLDTVFIANPIEFGPFSEKVLNGWAEVSAPSKMGVTTISAGSIGAPYDMWREKVMSVAATGAKISFDAASLVEHGDDITKDTMDGKFGSYAFACAWPKAHGYKGHVDDIPDQMVDECFNDMVSTFGKESVQHCYIPLLKYGNKGHALQLFKSIVGVSADTLGDYNWFAGSYPGYIDDDFLIELFSIAPDRHSACSWARMIADRLLKSPDEFCSKFSADLMVKLINSYGQIVKLRSIALRITKKLWPKDLDRVQAALDNPGWPAQQPAAPEPEDTGWQRVIQHHENAPGSVLITALLDED